MLWGVWLSLCKLREGVLGLAPAIRTCKKAKLYFLAARGQTVKLRSFVRDSQSLISLHKDTSC